MAKEILQIVSPTGETYRIPVLLEPHKFKRHDGQTTENALFRAESEDQAQRVGVMILRQTLGPEISETQEKKPFENLRPVFIDPNGVIYCCTPFDVQDEKTNPYAIARQLIMSNHNSDGNVPTDFEEQPINALIAAEGFVHVAESGFVSINGYPTNQQMRSAAFLGINLTTSTVKERMKKGLRQKK